MKIASGMGWTPDRFWKSTYTEFVIFAIGWQEANGAKTEEALDDMTTTIEAAPKRRGALPRAKQGKQAPLRR